MMRNIMKKTKKYQYISPDADLLKLSAEDILSGSDGTADSNDEEKEENWSKFY